MLILFQHLLFRLYRCFLYIAFHLFCENYYY